MNLEFKKLEEYLQGYIDGVLYIEIPEDENGAVRMAISLKNDLDKVSPAQRLGFIEKYLEFIEPKQLRRGTKQASGDMDFTFTIIKNVKKG